MPVVLIELNENWTLTVLLDLIKLALNSLDVNVFGELLLHLDFSRMDWYEVLLKNQFCLNINIIH